TKKQKHTPDRHHRNPDDDRINANPGFFGIDKEHRSQGEGHESSNPENPKTWHERFRDEERDTEENQGDPCPVDRNHRSSHQSENQADASEHSGKEHAWIGELVTDTHKPRH